MNSIPEFVPISDLRTHQGEILEKIKESPIVLAQRSKAVAVLVDPARWNKLMTRLEDQDEAIAVLQAELAVERGEEQLMDIDEKELEAAAGGEKIPS